MHTLVDSLLEKRNIEDKEQFLNPQYQDRHDPFLMKGMDVAVERILTAIQNKERIAVWSDYDCDGVPGGALMRNFFRMIEYPLISYIPERSEGYGLNTKGLDSLKEDGVSLVVTVDCGITDVDEVAHANKVGLDMIVTDHHLPQETLPDALAVLNPHQSDCAYPFKELCGTGVAFKLIEGLIKKNEAADQKYFSFTDGHEKWLLDLVALATVADMVELTDENRVLVHYGLMVMQKTKNLGLKALIEKARLNREHITEDDIAFSLAPKINAASRMKSPHLALELLSTDSKARADELAKELVRLNDARKLEGARIAKEVKKRIDGAPLSSVIVLGNSSWKPALLGIAASNVVETYGRTVCLWGKEGELLKGSCRSDGTVNIVELLSSQPDLFEDFGGHEQSGGFSLSAHAIHELPEKLADTYDTLKQDGATSNAEVESDGTLSVGEVTYQTHNALRVLAPFGMGNPKPQFTFSQALVEKVLYFGKHQEHVRVVLSDEHGNTAEAISFFFARNGCSTVIELLTEGDRVDVVGSVESSFFGGRRELRIRLEHVALCTPTSTTPAPVANT